MVSKNPVKKSRGVDTWKTKSWYSVIAPPPFEQKEIGKVVSGNEENLKNRVIRVSLDELSGGSAPTSVYTRVDLRIYDVKGKTTHTKLIGHELIPAYIKTIIRRRKSLITGVVDVTTQDNQKVRLKYLIVTGAKVSSRVKTIIRHETKKQLLDIASHSDFSTLMQELLFSRLQKRLYPPIKLFGPIKRIEIRKSEVEETFS
ncbi:MAG: hypothetical protein QXW70_04395 [Candidatus Anstonellales archaeon]